MKNEKTYTLLGANKKLYKSKTEGKFGGHKKLRIYGKLDCKSALGFIAKGQYVNERVFFQDEITAITTGFRPCGNCMGKVYEKWNIGGETGTEEYPWSTKPKGK